LVTVRHSGSHVTVGVLALQGDVREHIKALTACGVNTRIVRTAEELEGLDGLVIPGGESTTMSILAQRDGLLDPLRQFASAGHPCFGSCAGLIFLADRVEGGREDQATLRGLDVTARRNAFGRQVDSFETDLTLSCLDPEPFPAVFIRAPAIVDAGPQVEVLATFEDRIVAVRQGNLLATAFHPELTDDNRLHGYFVEVVEQYRQSSSSE
jgi:5'-phosphate synthase pdxT subunit